MLITKENVDRISVRLNLDLTGAFMASTCCYCDLGGDLHDEYNEALQHCAVPTSLYPPEPALGISLLNFMYYCRFFLMMYL